MTGVYSDTDATPDLVRRLADSDVGALDALFTRCHDGLFRFAEGLLGDRAAAADLVQEAFIRIWRHRASLDPERSPRALLYTAVRNLAFNHLRNEKTRSRLVASDYQPTMWRDPGPEAAVLATELDQSLRQWLDELPPRQREALTLSRFEGLSHDEIAEVMGVAPRTVNNHLVRALETIRRRLDLRNNEGSHD